MRQLSGTLYIQITIIYEANFSDRKNLAFEKIIFEYKINQNISSKQNYIFSGETVKFSYFCFLFQDIDNIHLTKS